MVLKLLQDMQIDGISEVFRRNNISPGDSPSEEIIEGSIDMHQELAEDEIRNFRSPRKPEFSDDFSREVVIDLRRKMRREDVRRENWNEGMEDVYCLDKPLSTPLKYSQSTPSLHKFSYRKNRVKSPDTFVVSPTPRLKFTMTTPKQNKFIIQKELSPQHFLKPQLSSTTKVNLMRTHHYYGRETK
jgi:hypothetical protein